MRMLARIAAVAMVGGLLGGVSQAQSGSAASADPHWVGSWAAAPEAMRIVGPHSPAAQPVEAAPSPAAANAPQAAPVVPASPSSPAALVNPEAAVGPTFAATTYREIVHLSLGAVTPTGFALRVVLTNEMGTAPLTIGSAHVALPVAGNNGAIQPATDHALTFNGSPSVIIPAGALELSDPVSLPALPFSDLAVSIYVPEQPLSVMTMHRSAYQTNFKMAGDEASAATPADATKIYSWFLLKGVEVAARPQDAAVVALGDSITDGTASTRDSNGRWPDVLAARLAANKGTGGLSVLDEGIGGNRVLHDVYGPSALARFDRDVLGQAGVKYLIVLESINDIGRRGRPNPGDELVSAEQLIAGLSQIAERAHAHGIKVFGATLTPYVGAGYATVQGEQDRQTINAWIRANKGRVFDGVIDFDKAVRDPAHPDTFLPAYDHGDHLHPNDAGLKAMGEAVDLNLFR
ncbi:MAG: SGNH/GDSL hydrolase family protein [Acidobacteriaceae bacterium]